jgi:hypothetical protein
VPKDHAYAGGTVMQISLCLWGCGGMIKSKSLSWWHGGACMQWHCFVLV